MIIHRNADRLFSGASYDETYSHDPERFAHAVTFRALEAVWRDHLPLDRPRRCLDLGCGQGQVITRVRDDLQAADPAVAAASELYGLDISPVAIEQCDARAPDIRWILDAFQDFLASPAAGALEGTLDLVINKGGLTNVSSQAEYRVMLAGIARLLSDGGVYLYVQNKQFYQVWSNNFCLDWTQDIFDLAGDVFGPPAIVPEPSAYAAVYVKRTKPAPVIASTGQPASAEKPRRLIFSMSDGTERTVFVSGDELTARRLTQLRAEPGHRSPPTHPGDRERVLVPGGRIRLGAAGTLDVHATVTPALERTHEPIAFTEMCPLIRHYCRHLLEWTTLAPDTLLLGLGLDDFKVHCKTGQPVVDLDEYRSRLDWVLETARRRVVAGAGGRVVWVATGPSVAFDDRSGTYRSDPAVARVYLDAAAEVCAEHAVPFAAVTPAGPDRAAATRAIAATVGRTLAATGAVACSP
ncbi:MAG: class I SAM-dependent methyltransferase [Phycisphaerales bacterium]|nr:class I SAM-dependent methyltransferase [Phycisphaerales bacterium]